MGEEREMSQAIEGSPELGRRGVGRGSEDLLFFISGGEATGAQCSAASARQSDVLLRTPRGAASVRACKQAEKQAIKR